MVDLTPVSILTGSPRSVSVDTTRLTDNTLIVDGYTYFYAAKVVINQAHVFSANSIVTGQPSVSSAAITQNVNLSANGILTGVPVLSSASVIVTSNLEALPILSGGPTLGSATITQNHSLSPQEIVTRSPDLGRPVDPDAIIAQEIKELQQMFGGWPRRAYEVPDGRLVQAEREIEATFGDRVSVDRKAKSLIKFGKSGSLSTNRETVWALGGMETYAQDNVIDSISSSSALDNQEIYLECHTVTGTGEDQQFSFLTQTVTLNGQQRVALHTPVSRVSVAYNNNGTELAGRVYVYENTPLVGGVPSDLTKVHDYIPQGFQQSFKAATTFSNSDYYILTGGFGSVSNKQAAAVDFYLEIRTAGKIFREVAAVSANSAGGAWQIELDPAVIIPKNADVRVTCETGDQGAVVYCSFKGYLAKVL